MHALQGSPVEDVCWIYGLAAQYEKMEGYKNKKEEQPGDLCLAEMPLLYLIWNLHRCQ